MRGERVQCENRAKTFGRYYKPSSSTLWQTRGQTRVNTGLHCVARWSEPTRIECSVETKATAGCARVPNRTCRFNDGCCVQRVSASTASNSDRSMHTNRDVHFMRVFKQQAFR